MEIDSLGQLAELTGNADFQEFLRVGEIIQPTIKAEDMIMMVRERDAMSHARNVLEEYQGPKSDLPALYEFAINYGADEAAVRKLLAVPANFVGDPKIRTSEQNLSYSHWLTLKEASKALRISTYTLRRDYRLHKRNGHKVRTRYGPTLLIEIDESELRSGRRKRHTFKSFENADPC